MRFLKLTLLSLFAGTTFASAASLPIGTYTLTGATTTTGIHQSIDQGTLTGTLTFNSASTLTSANLTFNDTTSAFVFVFTGVGATTIDNAGHTLSALITDVAIPSDTYAFSVRIPGLPDGSFALNCGTDCDTDVDVTEGRTSLNEEIQGSIAATTPEPSSLVLLGTGALGLLGAARRSFVKT